jgi:hypothetical protein
MYVIQYAVASGRTFIHVGTRAGIKKLLKNELNGVAWKFLSRHKFDPNEKEKNAA